MWVMKRRIEAVGVVHDVAPESFRAYPTITMCGLRERLSDDWGFYRLGDFVTTCIWCLAGRRIVDEED